MDSAVGVVDRGAPYLLSIDASFPSVATNDSPSSAGKVLHRCFLPSHLRLCNALQPTDLVFWGQHDQLTNPW